MKDWRKYLGWLFVYLVMTGLLGFVAAGPRADVHARLIYWLATAIAPPIAFSAAVLLAIVVSLCDEWNERAKK